jgi:NitT/TauT family transport system substrate-binding protein
MRNSISRRSVLAMSSGLIALPALISSRQSFAGTNEAVSVRLDFSPWGIHAPFHLAQAKGWFKDVGIDATFDDGNGSVATVQIVGNGQYDIGHASLGPMAIARGKGVPLRSFVTLFGQNDIGLMVDKSLNVKTIADIKGKTIAYTPGSLESPFLDKFLAAGGLTRADLSLQSVDASAKVGVYVNRRVDGVFSSPTFTMAHFAGHRATTVLRFADYGLDFLGYGLFSTNDTIAKRQKVLGRFADVVAGAWNYIFAGHEDEAVKAIVAARPQARLNPDVLRGQIEELRKYVALPGGQGSPALKVTAANWQATLKILSEVQLVPANAVAEDYFVPSLLDADVIARVSNGERPSAGK